MRTPVPIRITAACLLVTMSACTTWRPYQLEGSGELPKQIRVNLVTSESVQLASPFLEGDTALVGRVGRQYAREFRRVLLRDVESVEMPGRSTGGTVIGVALGVIVVGAVAWAIYKDCSGMLEGIGDFCR